jgi:hypothetical protein
LPIWALQVPAVEPGVLRPPGHRGWWLVAGTTTSASMGGFPCWGCSLGVSNRYHLDWHEEGRLQPWSDQASDQLRGHTVDHTGKTRRYWLVLKEIIRAAPCFFLLRVCWHGTSKQHFRSKTFAPRSWSCLATASGSRATHGGDIPPRRVLSSKHCGPVWRKAQLTDAIVLPLLKITM